MPADVLTDREHQQQAPAPPSGPTYAELASTLTTAETQLGERRAAVEKSLREEAAAVHPKLRAAQEAGQRLIREAEERYTNVSDANQQVAVTQAAQPSKRLTDFLAPMQGESPENTIAKLTQAIGIFGTAVAGATKGDARAGLAALTGAMKGWQEGDKERADRHFADWRASMDTALAASEDERRSYREWFMNANLTVDQMFKGAEIEARIRGNERMADEFAAAGLEGDVTRATHRLSEWEKAQAHLREQTIRLSEMAYQKDQDRQFKLALADLTAQRKDEKDKQLLDEYTPETIAILGQQWATKGTFPPGMGRSGAQAVIRARIVNAGKEWAAANGIDPMNLGPLQSEIKAVQATLQQTERNRGIRVANAANVEKHLQNLVEFSAKVPRGQSPLANKYELYMRGEIKGDADIAAYQAFAYELGQEIAKYFVGTAQGDEESRREGRRIVRGELNHEQLSAVAKRLNANIRATVEQQNLAVQEHLNYLNNLGAGTLARPGMPAGSSLAEPPSGGTMRIRKPGTTRTYEGPVGPVPEGYERVP